MKKNIELLSDETRTNFFSRRKRKIQGETKTDFPEETNQLTAYHPNGE